MGLAFSQGKQAEQSQQTEGHRWPRTAARFQADRGQALWWSHRLQESSGQVGAGHFRGHCMESAEYPGQVALFTGPVTDFLMVFPEPAVFVVPHSSLLIPLFATDQTRDQKAQCGPQKMPKSRELRLGRKVGYCHRWSYFGGGPFLGRLWPPPSWHKAWRTGYGRERVEFKRDISDFISCRDWEWINSNQHDPQMILKSPFCSHLETEETFKDKSILLSLGKWTGCSQMPSLDVQKIVWIQEDLSPGLILWHQFSIQHRNQMIPTL